MGTSMVDKLEANKFPCSKWARCVQKLRKWSLSVEDIASDSDTTIVFWVL